MSNLVLNLSSLRHTWLIDLDGTILKHNGYKIDQLDSFLPGAKDFLQSISNDFVILLTARPEAMREETIAFLSGNQVKFDSIIFGLPVGERVLINDDKPSGLLMGYCVNLPRDVGPSLIRLSVDVKK